MKENSRRFAAEREQKLSTHLGRTNHIIIDVDQIPDHARRSLAEGAVELMRSLFAKPGTEEEFQAWLKERKRTQKSAAGEKKKGKTDV